MLPDKVCCEHCPAVIGEWRGGKFKLRVRRIIASDESGNLDVVCFLCRNDTKLTGIRLTSTS